MGTRVGETKGGSHLFSERGDYRDFHLRAVCKISEGGASGIFFRCEYDVNRPRWGAWVEPQGYEAGISDNRPYRNGTLFGPEQSKISLKDAKSDLVKAVERACLLRESLPEVGGTANVFLGRSSVGWRTGDSYWNVEMTTG